MATDDCDCDCACDCDEDNSFDTDDAFADPTAASATDPLAALEQFRYRPAQTDYSSSPTPKRALGRCYRSPRSEGNTVLPSISQLHQRLNGFVQGAERRGKTWTLTDAEAFALFRGDCGYCGKGSTSRSVNGIDRIDNHRGYEVGNCISCCSACNATKGRHGVEQWLHQCLAVAAHLMSLGVRLPDGRHATGVLSDKEICTTVRSERWVGLPL